MIAALLTSRILIQFVGQIATIFYLRSKSTGPAASFNMPLFPLPALVSLAGWLFIFVTSEMFVLLYGVLSLVLGAAAFFVWDLAFARNDRGPAN